MGADPCFVVYLLIRSLIISRVDGVGGALRALLPLHKVLDDLDESEVQERRRHEGEFQDVQEAEEPKYAHLERYPVQGARGSRRERRGVAQEDLRRKADERRDAEPAPSPVVA